MSDQAEPRPSRTDAAPPYRPVGQHGTRHAPRHHGPFVPLLLGLAALAAWFGLQTYLLLEEGRNLRNAHSAQQQTVDNATRLRQSLDAVAADTQRLADSGNPNARLLVDELRRRGVTINPNPPAAPAPTQK